MAPNAQRFVISGLSRLTVTVVRQLDAAGADLAVVTQGAGRGGSDSDLYPLADLLPAGVRLVEHAGGLEAALRDAGLPGAACHLALADDDLSNLRAAAAGADVDGGVPVVLRTFDPAVADQLAFGAHLRRAFSVSALAGPGFVAAALEQEVLGVLRLADTELPVARLAVRPGSSLAGRTLLDVKLGSHCAVLARAGPDGTWHPAETSGGALRPGEEVVVAGFLVDVLRLAATGQGVSRPPSVRSTRRSHRPGWRRSVLPAAAGALALLVLASMLVYTATLDVDVIGAFERAVNGALGNTVDVGGRTSLRVYALLSTVAAVILLGVIVSNLAADLVEHRLERRADRAAARSSGHAVVAGFGNVGYRVARLFEQLDIPVVVLEKDPRGRFVDALGGRVPLLTGDLRLPENLDRAGVARAAYLVACTDDDVANVTACAYAHRVNPDVRAVARVFDETLVARGREPFGLDAVLSASALAAPSFVCAALDERAVRRFPVGGLDLRALRVDLTAALGVDEIEAWRARGLRFVARHRPDGEVERPSAINRLEAGDRVVVAGPAAEVDAFAGA